MGTVSQAELVAREEMCQVSYLKLPTAQLAKAEGSLSTLKAEDTKTQGQVFPASPRSWE